MEEYLDDSSRLKVELEKADALRELRPHLQKPARRGWFRSGNIVQGEASEQPITAYLARIVHAHLRCLISLEILRRDVDIEAFTKHALEDAKRFVDNTAVDSIAEKIREALVDVCRVVYLRELNERRQEWEACPISGSLGYDPDEEEKIRVEWEAMRVAREREDQARHLQPQATDDTPMQAAKPPAPDPVETCRSGTAFQNAEAASLRKDRKGDVTLIEGKRAVTFRTAEVYLGISERQRQSLVHADVLRIEGQGQNRKITTESLRVYLPPQDPK